MNKAAVPRQPNRTLTDIVKRSFFSAWYLVAIGLPLLLTSDFGSYVLVRVVAIPVLYVIGLCRAHICYENFLSIHKRLSESIVEARFREVTKDLPGTSMMTYADIRRLREDFLETDPDSKLARNVEHNLVLRQVMTYFCASSVADLVLIPVLAIGLNAHRGLGGILFIITALLLAGASRGHCHRSRILGEVYGDMYRRLTRQQSGFKRLVGTH